MEISASDMIATSGFNSRTLEVTLNSFVPLRLLVFHVKMLLIAELVTAGLAALAFCGFVVASRLWQSALLVPPLAVLEVLFDVSTRPV